jgi:hypothetical protein
MPTIRQDRHNSRTDPAEEVLLYGLATLALDVAALERGYHRPAGTPHRADVRVVTDTSRLRHLLGLQS